MHLWWTIMLQIWMLLQRRYNNSYMESWVMAKNMFCEATVTLSFDNQNVIRSSLSPFYGNRTYTYTLEHLSNPLFRLGNFLHFKVIHSIHLSQFLWHSAQACLLDSYKVCHNHFLLWCDVLYHIHTIHIDWDIVPSICSNLNKEKNLQEMFAVEGEQSFIFSPTFYFVIF